METITAICTVIKRDGKHENPVQRDKDGIFHCGKLKNGRCNLDKGNCQPRIYLSYLATIDANTSNTSRQPVRA